MENRKISDLTVLEFMELLNNKKKPAKIEPENNSMKDVLNEFIEESDTAYTTLYLFNSYLFWCKKNKKVIRGITSQYALGKLLSKYGYEKVTFRLGTIVSKGYYVKVKPIG